MNTRLIALLACGAFIPPCSAQQPAPRRVLRRSLDVVTQLRVTDTVFIASPRACGHAPSGIAIDSAFDAAFPDAYNQDGVFAILRTPLDNSRIGYLLRVPSQYESSAIDLWEFDQRRDAWRAPIRMADAFGDGPWALTWWAWLVDLNRDGHKDLVLRHQESRINETSLKQSTSDSLFIRMWDGVYAPATLTADSTLRAVFDPQRWCR